MYLNNQELRALAGLLRDGIPDYKVMRARVADLLFAAAETVEGPFVLTEEEAYVVRKALNQPLNDRAAILARALERAVRILGPALVEPLSDEFVRRCDYAMKNYVPGAPQYKLAAELLRRCPKPEPKPRTAEELAEDIVNFHDERRTIALAELVALAKK